MADQDDLEVPEGLSPEGIKAVEVILSVLRADGRTYTGGCKAFYSPKEWSARGEKYGHRSCLIVVHDGGDLASYFSYDHAHYAKIDRMDEALEKAGLFAEQCTTFYTAIYSLEDLK